MRHAVGFETEPYVTHSILNDLSPGIRRLIIGRKDLIFEDVIHLIQIIFVLLMDIHIFIIGRGDDKTIVSMIDEFHDPAVVG